MQRETWGTQSHGTDECSNREKSTLGLWLKVAGVGAAGGDGLSVGGWGGGRAHQWAEETGAREFQEG